MSWNIRHGLGNDGRVDLERVARVIRDESPDIVGLQEVDRFWNRSGNVDQSAEIARLLGMNSCYGANVRETTANDTPDREYGTLILTGHPIIEAANETFPMHDGFEPRGLLSARIEIPQIGDMTILNTHLQVGSIGTEVAARRQRQEQAEVNARRVRESGERVLFLGDFNAQPGDPELDPICKLMVDAWTIAGDGTPGFTIPTGTDIEPDSRIDMIFASANLHITASRVLIIPRTRLASDHYPVVATIEVR